MQLILISDDGEARSWDGVLFHFTLNNEITETPPSICTSPGTDLELTGNGTVELKFRFQKGKE